MHKLVSNLCRRREVWPRGIVYPLIGFLLAQGAPLGLLVTHAHEDGVWPVWQWLVYELRADQLAYCYRTLFTSTIFIVLGAILGMQEDRLRRLAATDGLTGLLNRRYFSLTSASASRKKLPAPNAIRLRSRSSSLTSISSKPSTTAPATMQATEQFAVWHRPCRARCA